MSGVVCATQAEPRGTMPPDEKPNKTEKTIKVVNVLAEIKEKVARLVKIEINISILNLEKSALFFSIGRCVIYLPMWSAAHPVKMRPTSDAE